MFELCWRSDDCHYDKGCTLFDVFLEHYAINQVKIVFNNGEHILLEKYNVIGWDKTSNIFNVYETPTLNVILSSFDYNDVKFLYVLY